MRWPVEKVVHSGEEAFLWTAGFPDEMKEVQNPIASCDSAASL